MAGKKTMEALALHKKGFNCAQAVLIPFAEELGLSKEQAMQISEGFGAGMGACKFTCGALSAAIMVAGLKNSTGNLSSPNSKQSTYLLSREITEAFEKEVGSCSCYDIRGLATKQPLKNCDECVMIGAKLAERVIGK